MKILTIVGARPQFIKAAMVTRELRKKHNEILVHTGQHYDVNMSDVFFSELGIPKPDYNLGISGGTHGKMTADMLIAIENVLLIQKPDAVLVYGDTNSTLSGALSAVKLHIPVIHIEAGLRFGTMTMPEEVNRVLTDKISTKLFCPTDSAVENLRAEGIKENVYNTGDVMYDAYRWVVGRNQNYVNNVGKYYLLTVHREENSNIIALKEILKAMEMLDAEVIYPVHPRNAKMLQSLDHRNVKFIEPVGYFESINLLNNCKKVITDSGGLQREAFFAGKQCVTLLDHKLWPETHVGDRNQLAKCEWKDILEKLSKTAMSDENYRPFGNGHAAKKIVEFL